MSELKLRRITAYQKDLLGKFYWSKYGDLHVGTGDRKSAWALAERGFISRLDCSGWAHITPQGKEWFLKHMSFLICEASA
jgi:hypothetical protein